VPWNQAGNTGCASSSVYNLAGQYFGTLGRILFEPPFTTAFSNKIIIGQPPVSDNIWGFVDLNGINSNATAFDYLETPYVDGSQAKNYNIFIVYVQEQGGLLRSENTGWLPGPMGSTIDLRTLWKKITHNRSLHHCKAIK
jgi:hypothetical protein